MKTRLLLSLTFVLVVALVPVGAAQAHGEPVIAVEPSVVAAGDQITVTGTEVEPGEVFVITLEGVSGSISLGEATVVGEGEEGEFTATFTIPTDTAPGSYTVRAATEEGESAAADLTVTASGNNASAGPAMVMEEPSGELHTIDRTRPTVEWIMAIGLIVGSAGLGLWLALRRASAPG
ncbi:MAG: hypothetical protein Fur0022_01850 [Anaerolineales bacterium]